MPRLPIKAYKNKPYRSPYYARSRPARPAVQRVYQSGETKYFDCELSNNAIAVITTAWGATHRQDPASTINLGAAAVATPATLIAPTVGSALNQRVGRKIHVRKIKIRGFIFCANQASQATADAPSSIRIALLQDKQTNAAQFTPADVLNPASAGGATLNSFQNPNGFGRFAVLKDKQYQMSDFNMANDTGATGGLVQSGKVMNFKMTHVFKKPVEINFNATNGGTVADIVDNSFHLMAATNNVAYAPTLSYYSRVCYTE